MKLTRTVFAMTALLTAHAFAEPYKVVDAEYVHDGWYKHFRESYGDWTTPPVLKNGTFYMRIEMIEYTGEQYPIMFQPCFFGGRIDGDHHACFHRGNGVFTFESLETRVYKRTMSDAWCYDCPDWTDVISFMLIDNYGNDKGQDKGIPKPRLRVEAYVVPPGESFVAPDHWHVDDLDACTDICVESGAAVRVGQLQVSPRRCATIHAGPAAVYDLRGRMLVRLTSVGTKELPGRNASGLTLIAPVAGGHSSRRIVVPNL